MRLSGRRSQLYLARAPPARCRRRAAILGSCDGRPHTLTKGACGDMSVELPPGSLGAYESYESRDGTKLTSYFVAPERRPAPAVVMLRGVAGPDSGYTVI